MRISQNFPQTNYKKHFQFPGKQTWSSTNKPYREIIDNETGLTNSQKQEILEPWIKLNKRLNWYIASLPLIIYAGYLLNSGKMPEFLGIEKKSRQEIIKQQNKDTSAGKEIKKIKH